MTRLATINEQWAHVARTHPIAVRLRQIPGVGVLSATALVAAVQTHVFRRGRAFASWLNPREEPTRPRRRNPTHEMCTEESHVMA